MSLELTLFVIGALLCGAFALFAGKWGPWRMMLAGLGITIFGAMVGVDMTNIGRYGNSQYLQGLGEVLMVFASVVGGAVVSTAFSELRAAHQKSSQR